jgi:hypothetical protein
MPGDNKPVPVTAMWSCPRCARTFANRNQTHTCAPLGDLDQHFARACAEVRSFCIGLTGW